MTLAQAIATPIQHYAKQVQKLVGLSNIYNESINLVVWQRTLENALQQAVQALSQSQSTWAHSEIVALSNIESSLKRAFPDFPGQANLIADITLLLDAFCCLFDVEEVGMRLTLLNRTMCPRFHIDNVPCRLITTYGGPATEWLEHVDVDRSKLGRGNGGLPDHESGLIHPNASIKQLTAGDVALLKGEKWIGNEGFGIVHRSPEVKPGESRLIMTFDLA